MQTCKRIDSTRHIGIAILIFAFSISLLSVVSSHAATPGLPFTEDFSDMNLMDATKTNATWSTDEQEIYLAWRKQLYGAMTDPTSYQIGGDHSETFAIAVGDVDGDGDMDVVKGGRPSMLFLNNGSEIPFFLVQGKIIGSASDDAYSIALGDMDRDGDLDVVTGSGNDPNRLYLNNGSIDPFNGVTGTAIGLESDNTYAIALGDVNGDGAIDVISGNWDQTDKLYLSNGSADPFSGVDGTNIGLETDETCAIALGDMDGDGDLDLVTTSFNRDEPIRLFQNNGTSDPFDGISGTSIGLEPDKTMAIALGDVDGDGGLDVVAGTSYYDKLYFNNGTADPFLGVDATVLYASSGYSEAIGLVDVDQDGDIDLFVADSDPHYTLFLNNGTDNPFFAATQIDIAPAMEDPRQIAWTDMDGDGDLDMVAGNYNQPDMLFLNNGTESPFNGVIGTVITETYVYTVDLGDINGDGYLDLVLGGYYTPHQLYLNNHNPDPFSGVSGTDIGADSDELVDISLGDVDGDGDLDVLAANRGQTNKLYLNNGTQTPFLGINGTNIGSDTDETTSIAVGDVDDDGDLDVVTGNQDAIKLYLNNGTSNPFSGISSIPIGEEPGGAVELVDIDGDDDLDIVAKVTMVPYQAKLFLNNGTSNPFSGVIGINIGADSTWNTNDFAVGDVDGDGAIDVVVSNHDQTNKLYLNNGTADPFGDVIGRDIGQEQDWTNYVALGDVDGDGDLDVVAINYAQTNKIYLNNGTSDPFNGINGLDIGPYSDGNRDITLGDVDQDGSLDLVLITGAFPTLYLNNGNVDLCTLCYDTGQGLITSIEVDTESIDNISNATLTHSDILPANTNIDYFLSNNGGDRFFQVYHGQEFFFPTQGNDLRWKAELHSLSPVVTPIVQQIVITNRNIAPEVTAGGVLSYIENDASTPIDPSIEIFDVDNVNFTSATIKIEPYNSEAQEDVLGFIYQNGISGTWNIETGEMNLSGISSRANYESALRSITYENTSDNPDETERTVTYTVNDDELDSLPVTSTITVARSNDHPAIVGFDPDPVVIVQEETITISINEQPAPSGHIHLTVDDPDNDPNDLSLIVRSGENYTSYSNTITPIENFFGTLTVSVEIDDGIDDVVYNINIQVDDVTDPTVSLVAVQVGGQTVDVTFSEPMGLGVADPDNYTLSGIGQGTLSGHPDEAVQFIGNTYRLTWNSGEMQEGGDVTITATGVQDASGRAIGAPNSGTDTGGGIGIAPVTGIVNAGGTYTSSVSVTLECTDSESGCDQTFYSTDGSYPTNDYADPILITEDAVLRFYAIDNAGNQEAVQTEIYSIEIPTTISCVLSDYEITYGEGFTITGSIGNGPPNNPDQGISIELIPTIGPTVFLSTSADVNGDFSLDVACDTMTGVGEWTVRTSWPGDSSHLGASCDSDPLIVSQADSHLTLDVVMSEAVKINSRPPIGGSFSPAPYCDTMDLSNTVITIYADEPDGGPRHTLTAYANQYGQFLLDYDHSEGGGAFAFDVLGDWTLKAEYAATTNFAFAQTDEVTIRVVPTAGYAIVVQGRVASGEGMPSHHKTASFVYEKLKDRQLLDDDIQYLSWLYHDGWDGDPSKANIQHAITEWARDKMDESYHPAEGPDEAGQPGDLYIIMVDHGWTDPLDDEEGVFFIHPDDPLTSTELASWLDDLQNNLTGAAADRNIVVILGFCRAGVFMDNLVGSNRIVIASADKQESSHRGPQDVDAEGQPLRDGEYFVSEFFKSVSFGRSIRHSFEEATVLTEAFTSTGSGVTNAPYYDDSVQHPLLNDNGDVLGSNELSSDTGQDGAVSEFLFIGASPPQGNDPGDVLVTRVAEAQFIGPDPAPGIVDLWAEVDSPADVRLIWLEVKPPNYDPIDPGVGFQIEMANFKKATTDVTGTSYQWNALGATPDPADLFDIPGTYQIFYFVKDDVTGHTSP
ncbi:FG-GAP-like repeat-containing protein, partial [Thermodesulfobacteriota bacterium]